MEADFSSHIAAVARRLLGEPNKQLSTSTQLRFGSRGSIAVEIAGDRRGQWSDHENSEGGGVRELIGLKGGVAAAEIDAWLDREVGRSNGSKAASTNSRIVTRYDYRDEQGRLVYQVERRTPRAFRQRRPSPTGGWIYDLRGVMRLLYRLPELLAVPRDAIVYIVEREKDADNLARLGLIVTFNSESTGKWRAHFGQYFAGRDVVIIPDNDEAGHSHARDVVRNIVPVARSVRVLELPDLALKGDVSDWLASGGTRGELEKLAAASPIAPAEPADPSTLRLVRFDDMRPRLADGYLIKHLLGSTALAVLFGAAGTGKTYLALYLALRVAAGEECFGRRVRRAGVAYVAAEAGRGIENRVAAVKHEFEFPETMPFAGITTHRSTYAPKRSISKN